MKTEKAMSSVTIALLCKEFSNAKKKLENKIVSSIKKALKGLEYETCRCVCLGDDRLNFIDNNGIHRVVNAIKLVPVMKMGIATKDRSIVLIAEGVWNDPEYRELQSIALEDSKFTPLEVLETIGMAVENMELNK